MSDNNNVIYRFISQNRPVDKAWTGLKALSGLIVLPWVNPVISDRQPNPGGGTA